MTVLQFCNSNPTPVLKVNTDLVEDTQPVQKEELKQEPVKKKKRRSEKLE